MRLQSDQVFAGFVLALSVSTWVVLTIYSPTDSIAYPMALASGAFGYLSHDSDKKNEPPE